MKAFGAVLLAVGLVVSSVAGVLLVRNFVTALKVVEIAAPSTTLHLSPGTYVIYERSGTERDSGTVSVTSKIEVHLSADEISMKSDEGRVIPVGAIRGSETYTRGQKVFDGVGRVKIENSGDYTVAVADAQANEMIIGRSIWGSFKSLALPLALSSVGGVVFLVGAILLLVAILRKR